MEHLKTLRSAALVTLGILSCHGRDRTPALGSVQFALSIPGGQRVDSVALHLVCPGSGVDIMHTLDVRRGEVVAVFGGLTPGSCSVTMRAMTDKGAECVGNQTFSVIARQLVKVVVPLVCQGSNDGPAGRALISATFSSRPCDDDRIKALYAIPANVGLGESTLVELQVHTGAVVGQPMFVWTVRNEPDDTGEVSLQAPPSESCQPGSAACMRVTCAGLGENPSVDPETGRPFAGVFVSVTYEDDECFDTKDVWLYCVQRSDCGDGVVEGLEQCEDGNTVDHDGCSSNCRNEICGDGIVQPWEECDGSAGVGPGEACSAECRRVVARCGDGVLNSPAEECDGAAGLSTNQLCGFDCRIVPVCGNGIVEGTEQCDSPGDATCVACRIGGTTGTGGTTMGTGGMPGTGGTTTGTGGMPGAGGTTGTGGTTMGTGGMPGAGGTTGTGGSGVSAQCWACIDAIDEVGPYRKDVCEPNNQCSAALSCLLRTGCWTAGVPAQCYCGPTAADLDNCEVPTFVPRGPCARELLAGAGPGAQNADVLNRYFDIAYPTGQATIITDAAFQSCAVECF